MKPILLAAMFLSLIFPIALVRADDPNPEVAKAIEEIAARRAEKEVAQAKQVEQWGKGEARERGAANNPAQGANPKKADVKK